METCGRHSYREVCKKRWRAATAHLGEYCRSSGMHGLQYLGDVSRPLLERILWALALLLSLSASLLLIGQAWAKWEESPVIVSLEDRLRSVWQLPFPAVTICPETKFRASLFDQGQAEWHYTQGNLTDHEAKLLQTWELVCEAFTHRWGNVTADSSNIDIIEKMAPQLEDSLGNLRWQEGLGKNFKPAEIFRPLLTDEGLCFSSNMLPGGDLFTPDTFHAARQYLEPSPRAADWALDEGYIRTAAVHSYPRRALGAGLQAGLSVTLMLRPGDISDYCSGPVQGFKILIHSPAEFPRVGQQFLRVPLGQAVEVTVTPDLMTTSPLLLGYPPARRQCYFSAERKLRFFKLYTQQNCALECLANFTLATCGCVGFYMPRLLDTPVCGPSKVRCIWTVPSRLLELEVYRGLVSRDSRPQCDCLQACTDLQYRTERSQTDYDWGSTRPEAVPDLRISRLSVFFKSTQFLGSRRGELYGQSDFLANCGGLLGLGVGFSVLSLVELLYWLGVRRTQIRPARRSNLALVAPSGSY